MEHPDTPPVTELPNTPASQAAPPATVTPPSRTSLAERKARNDWLVSELRRLAAATDNPNERANLRRSADSLIRLATAFRS